ncbi:MAG: methylmalonyl-CoA epimerase [Calditrichaeota bacterium]|nr:MAG: methylmalonyl-CoA epimerase [Calditrichota bacterium]
MIKRVDHVGIAVKSLDAIKKMYREVFNMEPHFEEVVEEQKVRVAGYKLGETNLEYLEPLDDSSPISGFLEKRGEGLHHIAWNVENIQDVLNRMKSQGLRLIDEEPRVGAEGKLIAFVHPKSMNGVLLELSQDV